MLTPCIASIINAALDNSDSIVKEDWVKAQQIGFVEIFKNSEAM